MSKYTQHSLMSLRKTLIVIPSLVPSSLQNFPCIRSIISLWSFCLTINSTSYFSLPNSKEVLTPLPWSLRTDIPWMDFLCFPDGRGLILCVCVLLLLQYIVHFPNTISLSEYLERMLTVIIMYLKYCGIYFR